MKKVIFTLLLAIGIGMFIVNYAVAGEHPGESAEHPEESAEHMGKEVEHKEHPGKTHSEEHPGEKAALTADNIIDGIKGHIDSVTKVNNGYYLLYDAEEGKTLRLKLLRVHEDRVSYIKKENAYFACTDFITDDGKATYDIDFWMKDTGGGKLQVNKTKIHKKDGVPRFTYKDDEIVPVEEGFIAPEESTHMAPEEPTH